MKKQKIFLIPLLFVIVLAMILGIVFWFHNPTESIVGGWETEASVINPYSAEKNAVGQVQFYFYEDLNGTEILISQGNTTQRDFTYQIIDDTLCITHKTGAVWNFPYTLKDDVLTLEQNAASIKYHKIKEN